MANQIDALLQENRTFEPTEELRRNASANDPKVYDIPDREAGWAEELDWKKKWDTVAKKIGAIARPETILVTADLPKTRSGKIMRRLLRDIAEGRALGDVTTLADPTVVASLKDRYEEEG